MLKIFAALIFLPLLSLFLVSDKSNYSSNSFPMPSPTKTPSNENREGVESLVLSDETVYQWCPSMSDSAACSKSGLKIKVKTFSKSAEKNNLSYYYIVTNGKISGQGSDVIWDFTNAKPGKYTITASVGSDNTIQGETITKTVEVRECPDCDYWAICECPAFEISGPTKPIKIGDSIIILAKISGGSQELVTYNWKIMGGTIISEKNAPQIIVKTDSNKKNFSVTATLKIGGLCATCPNEESETFQIK